MINWLFKKKIDNKNQITSNILYLLRLFKINLDYKQIEEILTSHPDFPNLIAISETLNELNIKTGAVKGSINDLSEKDFPSIVFLNSGIFVVLKDIYGNNITLYDKIHGEYKLTLDEFSKEWSGILLRTEHYTQTNTFPIQPKKLSKSLTNIAFFGGLTVLGIWVCISNLNHELTFTYALELLFLKSFGLILCLIMTSKNLSNSTILDNLCSSGKRINCLKVMNSPAGKIFNIPMADIGLIYFVGGIAAILLSILTKELKNALNFLVILNIFTLPYTLFSLIYQAFIIKTWSWICIVLQAIFWLEFFIFIRLNIIKNVTILSVFSQISVIAFITVILLWIFIRNYIIKSSKLVQIIPKLLCYRRNPDFLKIIISQAEKYEISRFENELIIGLKDAPIILTIVINPLCKSCGDAFRQLQFLINLSRGRAQGVIRFLVKNTDSDLTEREKSEDYKIALVLISIAQKEELDLFLQALNDWFLSDMNFSKTKYRKWMKRYNKYSNEEIINSEKIVKKHQEWAKSCRISATPTCFYDNIKLPFEIKLDDLKYFILRHGRI